MVLVEAAASGVPVVASRVGGVPEIVMGGSGELVPAGDVAALIAALTAAAADRAGWLERGRTARRIYDSAFTPEHSYVRLIEAYRLAGATALPPI
jgi:glycosyltransferase involved in cell wall biosynthesis